MIPCPCCGCHILEASAPCPHCGARLPRTRGLTIAALLLSLSFAGCSGDKDTESGDTGETDTAPTGGVDYGSPSTY